MGGALVSLQGSLTLIAIKRKVNKKQNSFYSMGILRLSVTQTNVITRRLCKIYSNVKPFLMFSL